MKTWSIPLPYPPSVNSYWRHSRGITYISKKGREYRERVIDIIHGLHLNNRIKCRVAVKIYMAPPDRRARDIDNIEKCLFDALTHAEFWEDDSQIDYMVVERCQRFKGGKILIVIREREPELLDIHEVLE